MTKTHDLQIAVERTMRAFAARPATAQETTTSRATLCDGFATTVHENGIALGADLSVAIGGGASAPSPGVYGRACLASCVAMGIRIAATRRGLSVDEITVDLAMDWDSRGIFGTKGVSAGPGNICLTIGLRGDAAEGDLHAAVAEGLRNDPWLVALTQPHVVATNVQIVRAA